MDGGAKQVPQPLELQREHAHASVGDMWSIYNIFWLPRQWTRVAGSHGCGRRRDRQADLPNAMGLAEEVVMGWLCWAC